MSSLSKTLELGKENSLPELENESLILQEMGLCYKIVSKANGYNYFNREYRTFTVSFGDHLTWKNVRERVIIYATSYENSFAVDQQKFYHGKPHITEILLNHHAMVSIKPKRTFYSKEKNPDCEEETYWEKLEKEYIPRVKEACPNPCSIYILPSASLKHCEQVPGLEEEFHCSINIMNEIALSTDRNYSFDSCSFEEYEEKFHDDNLIPGKHELFYWKDEEESYVVEPWEILFPNNPGGTTVKFSYNFDYPETMMVQTEHFIATFEDIIGIVGGTLGMFIGFDFFDNILSALEYLIMFVDFVKRFAFRKKVAPKSTKLFTKVTKRSQNVQGIPKGSTEVPSGNLPEVPLEGPQVNHQVVPQEVPLGVPQEFPQEVTQEVTQEVPQEVSQEGPQEVPQVVPQEVSQEVPLEVPKEGPQEVLQEVLQEVPTEAPQEEPLELPLMVPQEAPKEASQVVPQVGPQDGSQRFPQEGSKEGLQEDPQGFP